MVLSRRDDADLFIPTLCFDCSSLADFVEEQMFFDALAAVPALTAAVRLAGTTDDGGFASAKHATRVFSDGMDERVRDLTCDFSALGCGFVERDPLWQTVGCGLFQLL